MSSEKAKQFVELVKENKMVDAKKVFERTMQLKVVDTVTKLRKEVASKFFNKD